MNHDQQLRLIALAAAIKIEGDKALSADVLAAAQEIYEFLAGAPAERPN